MVSSLSPRSRKSVTKRLHLVRRRPAVSRGICRLTGGTPLTVRSSGPKTKVSGCRRAAILQSLATLGARRMSWRRVAALANGGLAVRLPADVERLWPIHGDGLARGDGGGRL